MLRVGQRRKRDANEKAIRAAWLQCGIQSWPINVKGFADVITFSPQRGWLPVEIKSATGVLTPAQQVTAGSVPIPVVRTVAEGLALFGVQT